MAANEAEVDTIRPIRWKRVIFEKICKYAKEPPFLDDRERRLALLKYYFVKVKCRSKTRKTAKTLWAERVAS